MNRTTRFSVACSVAAAVFLISACADRKSPVDPSVPQPTLTSITPVSLQPSNAPQTLTFAGSGFDAGVRLQVTPPDGIVIDVPAANLQGVQPTTFQAAVVLAQTGVYSFAVRTVAGGLSQPLTVVIQPSGSTLPSATVVTPTSVPRSTQGTLVSIQGTNFAPNASIMVTDPNGTLMILTASQLSMASSTGLQFTFTFSVRGTYTLVVMNPGGDSSNPLFVTAT